MSSRSRYAVRQALLVSTAVAIVTLLAMGGRCDAQWPDGRRQAWKRFSAQLQVVDVANVAADYFMRHRRWPAQPEIEKAAAAMHMELPRSDPWGHSLELVPRKEGNALEVLSYGEDGIPHTDDDVIATTWRGTGGRLRSRRW